METTRFPRKMTKLISLFNHKGGVSKTTTAFNLGWMIARQGRRVLLVDTDPQCNLTGTVLGFEHLESTESIEGIRDGQPLNLREGLAPAFEAKPEGMKPVRCVEVARNKNLYLLPGHIGLAEYEVTLGIAQELSGSVMTLRNLPGSMNSLIKLVSEKYRIDFVIFDMSPSLGAINQNIWSISDFFLVPMNPDYFALMAVDSLANVLPKWVEWKEKAQSLEILKDAEYPFPSSDPKFIGYVMQKFRPRGQGAPSQAFAQWIEQVEQRVADTLIPAFEKANLMLPECTYRNANFDPKQAILQMSDFNSLIARSQECQVPIFELSDEQLKQVGRVLETTRESMDRFRRLFEETAKRVIRISEI